MLKTTIVLSLCGIVSGAFAAEKIDLSKIDVSKLPPAADRPGVTFDQDIRPMLEASCVRCHGNERPKANLRLNSKEAVLQGAKDGKVVVPGDSTKSLLVIAAAQIDADTAMPPKHRPGRGGPSGQGGRPPGAGAPAGDQPQSPPPGAPPGGGRGNFGPPPKPLTTDQVRVLRAWVDQGAK